MAISIEAFEKLPEQQRQFSVLVDNSSSIIESCLRLKYDVFTSELRTEFDSKRYVLDWDRYDDYYQHVAVIDNRTNEIIATTRLLDGQAAQAAHGFYSETKFDLSNILDKPYQYTEMGRTYIHPGYRHGSALSMIWRGIARYIVDNKTDYLFGCTSIPFRNGDKYLRSMMYSLRQHHFSDKSLRVYPRIPIVLRKTGSKPDDVIVPTMLKAYLRQGAVICGEPYWNTALGVADVFAFLDGTKITQRYDDHFKKI